MKRPNISAEHSVERAANAIHILREHVARLQRMSECHTPDMIESSSNAEGESRAASARTLHPLVGLSGGGEK